jgi:CHAD domain-containing protein
MSTLPLHDPAPAPAARIVVALEQLSDAFAEAALRVRRGHDDEAIHDVRVATRRLIAALSLWRALLRGRARRASVRRLRKLRRALGPTRETEVHLADIEARIGDQPFMPRLVLRELAVALRVEVAYEREQAAKHASASSVRAIARRLERAAGAIEKRAATETDPLARARARLERAGLAARTSLEQALALGEDAALHAARIAVKKWRYAIEAFEAAGGDHAGPTPKSLRATQEVLGTIHDRAAVRDRLARATSEWATAGRTAHADALRPLIATIEAERVVAVEQLRGLMRPESGATPPLD